MNWDAISGIAEAIGAAGVIGSLIYVGYQIRQNTKATQRTNARQTHADHATALHAALDEQVSEIVLRGIENIDALTPQERYRFDIVVTVWLEAVEQAFADYRQEDFPEDLIQPFGKRIAGILGAAGGRKWWAQRSEWFSDSFRKEVDSLLENPPVSAERAGIKPSI